jgi:hypothetical protein
MAEISKKHPVEIISVLGLISMQGLAIPSYQRPYKWTETNCNELFFDIKEALDDNKSAYRLGNLIFHKSPDSKLNIVDGQQRTISLFLLLKELGTEEIRKTVNIPALMLISHHVSISNLNKNRRLFKSLVNDSLKDDSTLKAYLDYILNKCQFVRMITTSEYQSFQMFDSQNSRGKGLDPRDLLKAYHLRELSEGLSEEEINKIDKRWVSNTDKINALLERVIYPIKSWSKGETGKDSLMNHVGDFKGISVLAGLNRCHNYARLPIYVRNYVDELNKRNETNISFGILGKVKYPFQLTGQILNGQSFFEMIFHYCDLVEEITQRLSGFCEDEGIKDMYLTTQFVLAKSEQNYYKFSIRLFYNLLLVVIDRFNLGADDFKAISRKLFKYSLSLRSVYQTLQEKTYLKFASGDRERISQNMNVCQFVLTCKNIKDLMKFNVCINNENSVVSKRISDEIKKYLGLGEKNGK